MSNEARRAKQIQSQLRQLVRQLQGANPAVLFLTSIGNPEPRFANTRHNAGHLILEKVRSCLLGYDKTEVDLKNASLAYSNSLPGLVFVKSKTFMNESGLALKTVCQWYDTNYSRGLGHEPTTRRFLVLHDDMDVDLGMVRIHLTTSSHRGHNGLRDISKTLGEEYPRLRIGIERAGESRTSDAVSRYVLGKFTPAEYQRLETDTLPRTLDYLDGIIKSDILLKR